LGGRTVSHFTVYYWVEARKIPHYRLGRRVLFSRTELVDWLKKHRVDDVA
jgi:excisionase family DNA binding protein